MDINFILCDTKSDLVQEWTKNVNKNLTIEERANFTILEGKLEDFDGKFDCIVSPANSNARLDGAFDLIISKMFAPYDSMQVTRHAQKYIYAAYNGYQPPGTSMMIPMLPFASNAYDCRYLLHTPTMRMPSDVRWNKEIVYNCMWTLLCEIRRHNIVNKDKIKSVFLVGLATGIGRIPPSVAASQMILAYRHFIDNLKNSPETSWSEATQKSLDIEETYRSDRNMF